MGGACCFIIMYAFMTYLPASNLIMLGLREDCGFNEFHCPYQTKISIHSTLCIRFDLGGGSTKFGDFLWLPASVIWSSLFPLYSIQLASGSITLLACDFTLVAWKIWCGTVEREASFLTGGYVKNRTTAPIGDHARDKSAGVLIL